MSFPLAKNFFTRVEMIQNSVWAGVVNVSFYQCVFREVSLEVRT